MPLSLWHRCGQRRGRPGTGSTVLLNERGNGLIDDETPFALALLSGHGYVFPLWATFHPQAWQNDYAVDFDPGGPTRWQVTTDYLLSITHRYPSDIPEAREEP